MDFNVSLEKYEKKNVRKLRAVAIKYTFSQSKIISSPPATLQHGLLNLQITRSDIAFLS